MRPFKIKRISTDLVKIKTELPSNSQAQVGINTERYIDYTNFKDGYVLVYDSERNRYHFVNPDEVLDNTYKQETEPQIFSDELNNTLKEIIDIDMGEY